MNTTDPSLILSALGALAVLLGAIAALVTTAFVAGPLIGQARRPPP